MQKLLTRVLFAAGLTVTQVTGATAQSAAQITILYDAFGPESALKLDWGFAALLEYQGKRILFDTGNNAKVFEHNVQELKVDLKNLDAVVISIDVAVVAAFAARLAGVAAVTKTSTFNRTSSAARAGSRSWRPYAHRGSIATFWPSIQPSSRKPSRHASQRC